MVHFIIKMKNTFPISAPAGAVARRYPFRGKHHEHIINEKNVQRHAVGLWKLVQVPRRGREKDRVGLVSGSHTQNPFDGF